MQKLATRGRRAVVLVGCALATAGVLGGSAAGSTAKTHATVETITVNLIPIANTLPLDIGIQKGFFQQQGIEIKKNVLQSGNDVVLALANKTGEAGFAGWVPAMIARTTGIPITAVALSEVEATTEAENWQNIVVPGSSSIRGPADLIGKTVAVNALKGVGEVMIRAAFDKLGLDSSKVKLVPIAFPAMRTAMRNGQVDAIWAPEPFLTQALTQDGARSVMAPGPILGKFFPIGGYFARTDWVADNPELAARFRTAMNQALTYSQTHPDDVRALLPAAIRNIRLPIWTTTVDRQQLLDLARDAKKYGAISTLPNFTQLVPSAITGGKFLQATVGKQFITLRQDGKIVAKLAPGRYTIVVTDNSNAQRFRLVGPGVRKATSVKGTGRATWTVTLEKGRYVFDTGAKPARKKVLTVA